MNEVKECLKQYSKDNYNKVLKYIENLQENTNNLEQDLLEILKEESIHDVYVIFILSVLAQLFPRIEYLELLIESILLCDFPIRQKKFFYTKLLCIDFAIR